MDCPVCKNVKLLMADKQGVEIDYCPNCRGIWLDRGELEKIIDRSKTITQQYNMPHPPPQQQGNVYIDSHKQPHPNQQHYSQDKYYNKKYKKRDNPLEEIFDIFDIG